MWQQLARIRVSHSMLWRRKILDHLAAIVNACMYLCVASLVSCLDIPLEFTPPVAGENPRNCEFEPRGNDAQIGDSTGNCCEMRFEGGCSIPEVEKCVCEIADDCCGKDSYWSWICVDIAASECLVSSRERDWCGRPWPIGSCYGVGASFGSGPQQDCHCNEDCDSEFCSLTATFR